MSEHALQNSPQPADQGVSRPVALGNLNPDSPRGAHILALVAGAFPDAIEAFANVARPRIEDF